MGKKKRGERGELLHLVTLQQQRWAYERVLEHLSYAAMAGLAPRPVAAGGLGVLLSAQQLKGLVKGYRDRLAEVEEHTLEEHRERELNDLAVQQRRHELLAQVAAHALEVSVATGDIDHDAAKLLLAAEKEKRATGESRRKLLGLDAPQQLKAEVSVRDAVTEELNDMLIRAGRKPVKVEK